MTAKQIAQRDKKGRFVKGIHYNKETEFKTGVASPRLGKRKPGWTNQTSFKKSTDLWETNPRKYQSIHDWIKRQKGVPKYCEFCKRTDKNLYHWANKSGKYLKDINDWMRLCNNCHQRYDLRRIKTKKLANMILTTHFNGGLVLLIGNGGSLSLCDHFAAELVGKFEKDRGLMTRAVSLSSPTVITAIGNDYGYEHVFSRQIESLGNGNSLLIVMTTSDYDGIHNKNLWNALYEARRKHMKVALMCAERTERMNTFSNCTLRGVGSETAEIQNSHLELIHLICRDVEKKRWK